MKQTAFDKYHPIVAAAYLVAALAFTMAVFHPVYIGVSLVAALIVNVYLKGIRAVLLPFRWQLPLIILITVVNPIFSESGSYVLFTWGGYHAYYLESLLYGLSMALMLVSVMTWFSNFTQILTSDKIMQLTGNVIPTIGLMITMILRLIPQFVRRSTSVGSVQSACTCAGSAMVGEEGSERERSNIFVRKARSIRGAARNISVIMGWGMEDSLEMAEAMHARGWGAASKRTTYRRRDFRLSDGIILGIIILFIVLSTITAVKACTGFSYYPYVVDFPLLWWGYVPFIVLLIFPFVLEIKERLLWRR